ncbi:YajQ family cyclic di-GMP-binding protein [Catenovulum sp. 2E275]|uniref:YajQ family cyclic di-GMP-binding protein n=1 Tax=Catenovulum sp. 2E275 TaxID=2980497 RepID=UPI0021CE9149|nr:YajQ family cyclic di-GMP-binding protein [Catenovulum sp. 2E275]MCU4675125.1 YajQ family cyclic di-GMP-binding protein [Catenovulum sp. 2E275]
MPSFDIVTETEQEEIRNAADNSQRELSTRFDFKGVEAEFEYNKDSIKLIAEADFQLDQMVTMLRGQLAKRNVDPRSIKLSDTEHSGKTFRKTATFIQGIDAPTAKKIVKLIKDSKLKVQASIQGEQVRVTGKKRDDLQAVMQLIRGSDLELPFQFNNFRD